jgi:hypothetical protein
VTHWRAGGLTGSPAQPVFTGIHHDVRFSVVSSSECLNDAPHDLEEIEDCTCGFHVHSEPGLVVAREPLSPWTLLLGVKPSGMVVEHVGGVRASRQRVTHVVLRTCRTCSTPAQGWSTRLEPTCASGACPPVALTCAELSARLSVQVPGFRPVEVSAPTR